MRVRLPGGVSTVMTSSATIYLRSKSKTPFQENYQIADITPQLTVVTEPTCSTANMKWLTGCDDEFQIYLGMYVLVCIVRIEQ